jgi:hypothetical protein
VTACLREKQSTSATLNQKPLTLLATQKTNAQDALYQYDARVPTVILCYNWSFAISDIKISC